MKPTISLNEKNLGTNSSLTVVEQAPSQYDCIAVPEGLGWRQADGAHVAGPFERRFQRDDSYVVGLRRYYCYINVLFSFIILNYIQSFF